MRQAEARGLYYGWKVLIALFLAGFMVYGGGLYSFVLFVVPLTQEFHWNRAATGGLVTAFWLSAPLILFGGFAIKRFGAKRMLIAGILLEALCVALLSTVSSFWQMYLLRAAMGLGKIMFAVTLPYSISRWFSRHYSFGLGITWAGWHVGGLVLAPLTGWIIGHFGWRAACLTIAVGLLTVGLVPTLLTQRARSPRQLGLGLDGDPLEPAASGALAPEQHDTPPGALADLLVDCTVNAAVLCHVWRPPDPPRRHRRSCGIHRHPCLAGAGLDRRVRGGRPLERRMDIGSLLDPRGRHRLVSAIARRRAVAALGRASTLGRGARELCELLRHHDRRLGPVFRRLSAPPIPARERRLQLQRLVFLPNPDAAAGRPRGRPGVRSDRQLRPDPRTAGRQCRARARARVVAVRHASCQARAPHHAAMTHGVPKAVR